VNNCITQEEKVTCLDVDRNPKYLKG